MRLAVIWVGELLCRSMSDPKSENDCELQIDPELLAKMHAHCRRIEAELEAQLIASSRLLQRDVIGDYLRLQVLTMPAKRLPSARESPALMCHQPEWYFASLISMTNAYDLRHDRKSLDPDDH